MIKSLSLVFTDKKTTNKKNSNEIDPDEVKSDIAKALEETMKEYKQQMKSLRQNAPPTISEAG